MKAAYMKRCISAALVLLMLMGTLVIPAAADDALSVTLRATVSDTVTDAMAVGDVFTVDLELDTACTIGSMDVRLVYDADVLEIDAGSAAWSFPPGTEGNSIVATVGGKEDARSGAVVWAAETPVSADAGVFVSIPFRVAAIPDGYSTTISLESREVEGAPNTYYNVSSTPITVSIDHEHETNADNREAAIAASCTNAGNIEYYKCIHCGRLFRDRALTDEVTAEETVVPKLGHSMQHTPAKAPTSTEDGNIEYWYCSLCKSYYSTESGYKADGMSSRIELADTVIAKVDILYGDVNDDGKVDSMDYSKLKQYLLHMIDSGQINILNADCNGDDSVDAMDYSKLKQYLLRMITKLGP